MNLARILYPVEVLGPGKRIGIWLCGCSRGCKGCSNPELWTSRPEYEITPQKAFVLIERIAAANKVDGFTISGGEPMDQTNGVAELLKMIGTISHDIIIYTGYRMEELQSRSDPETDYILRNAAALIDGEYIQELNNNSVLRGSSNQRIHILNNELSGIYQTYLTETHNQIQNFVTTDGIVSVGIHRPSFMEMQDEDIK